MRMLGKLTLAWLTLATPIAAVAAEPDLGSAPTPGANVIGSHQIDRYEAITQAQEATRTNPDSLADWIIVGELGHEVALDGPPDQAAKYLKISRDAYEKAAALAPDNAGLKAAMLFARDQETGVGDFEAARRRAAQTYLEARRRDLAATEFDPSIRMYSPTSDLPTPPVPRATTPTPGRTPAPAEDTGPPIAGQKPTTAPRIGQPLDDLVGTNSATTSARGPAPRDNVGASSNAPATTPDSPPQGTTRIAPGTRLNAGVPAVRTPAGEPATVAGGRPARAVGGAEVARAPAFAASSAVAPAAEGRPYPASFYRAYAGPGGGASYRQFNEIYTPPNVINPDSPPVTVQRYLRDRGMQSGAAGRSAEQLSSPAANPPIRP